MHRRSHPISYEAVMRPRPAPVEQPWLDDENEFQAPELVKPPPVAVTSGGKLARLKAEREWVLAKYDYGAMPQGVYAVVRNLEIEISELQMRG